MRPFSVFNESGTFVTLASPVKVYYDVNYGCNLNCLFCYVEREEAPVVPTMEAPSRQRVERILHLLKESEVMDLIILGGEPFEYGHIVDTARIAHELGLATALISNGTQITRELARGIAPFINSCAVSFRGPDAYTFEKATRTEGSFEAAIHGLQLLMGAGVTLSLLFDPLPWNHRDLFETVRMLVEDRGLHFAGLQLNRTLAKGRARKNWQQVSISSDAYCVLFEQMLQIRDVFGIRACAGDAFPFCRFPERYWPLLARCEYGVLFAAVTSEGVVKRCQLSEMPLGNLLEQPLRQIWQTSASLLSYRALCWMPECRECLLIRECTGGCAVSSDTKGDSRDSFDPHPFHSKAGKHWSSSLRSSTNSPSETGQSSHRLAPDSCPRLTTSVRFRDDTIGVLCIPESPAAVIEQGERCWLVVDDAERTIIGLCDGQHAVDAISAAVHGRFPNLAEGQVGACLTDLYHLGYIEV